MSNLVFDQQLLENLKREAKKKKRADSSLSYNQWLDVLSARHGYATYASLKRHVEEIEQQARERAEEEQWVRRFEKPLVWGSVTTNPQNVLSETLPLPVVDGSVPWPNCFSGSSIFTCAEGARRQFDGPLFSMDGPEMYFHGEELRVADDETILMALISATGKVPCGRLVEFSSDDLDRVIGRPLPECGMPVQYSEIARTLWRLVHSELKVPRFNFEGPILLYADARQQPQKFAIRFNPKFANFFYPVLSLFDM